MAELSELAHTLVFRIGGYLERQGLLERDIENSYLVGSMVPSRYGVFNMCRTLPVENHLFGEDLSPKKIL